MSNRDIYEKTGEKALIHEIGMVEPYYTDAYVDWLDKRCTTLQNEVERLKDDCEPCRNNYIQAIEDAELNSYADGINDSEILDKADLSTLQKRIDEAPEVMTRRYGNKSILVLPSNKDKNWYPSRKLKDLPEYGRVYKLVEVTK